MSLADLLALLPDNTTGQITAANMRKITSELYGPTPLEGVALGPFNNLPAAMSFVPLPAPGPVTGSLTLDEAVNVLVILSAYLDSGANNNNVSLGLDLTGATVVPVASKPERIIQVGGKSWVQVSLSMIYVVAMAVGTTNAEVRYTASVAGANVSNIALTAVMP
jgi:hypothetical protein